MPTSCENSGKSWARRGSLIKDAVLLNGSYQNDKIKMIYTKQQMWENKRQGESGKTERHI